MSGRALLVGLLGALACAHKPPPPQSETFAPQNDTPPPRGFPPPRAAHLPEPPPNPGGGPGADTVEQRQRFPILQGEAYKEARERERLHAAGDIEVVAGTPPGEVCDAVSAEDRVSCPLRPDAIEAVRDMPGGVVIRLRPGTMSAERLTGALTCQRALAQASPRDRALCPFLDTTTSIRVVGHGRRVEVQVKRAGDVDGLREQVHGLVR